jgi:CBS domain containing-hemolysin-like protein
VGEGFSAWGMRVEVVDMDGNRVDRLLIARANEPNEDA